jgi:hypothetical protein
MKTNILGIAIVATAIVIVAPTTSYSRGGLVCGAVQRAYFGLSDRSLNLAREWANKFPHTVAQPGAVVVQWRNGRDSAGNRGAHVSRIVAMRSNCSAIVADEKGQYERDICSSLIAYVSPVDPHGNQVARVERTRTQYSAKRRHTRVASAHPAFVPADRLTQY